MLCEQRGTAFRLTFSLPHHVGFPKLPTKQQLTVDNRLSPPGSHPISPQWFLGIMGFQLRDALWYRSYRSLWQGKNKDGKTQGEKPQSRHMVSWPQCRTCPFWKLLQSLEIWNRLEMFKWHLCDFSRCFSDFVLKNMLHLVIWINFGWILDGFGMDFGWTFWSFHSSENSWFQLQVPTPLGLSFCAAFEELDAELCRPPIRAYMVPLVVAMGIWDIWDVWDPWMMMSLFLFFESLVGLSLWSWIIMNFMTSFYFLTIPTIGDFAADGE